MGHEPFHKAVPIRPPPCSTSGLAPHLTRGIERHLEHDDSDGDGTRCVRSDGVAVSTSVWHAVVSDAERVSDVFGRSLDCTMRTLEMHVGDDGKAYPKEVCVDGERCRLQLVEGRTLAIEAGCGMGKTYAVHHLLIRPLLLHEPSTPMLLLSVRITHADDMHQTCMEHYVEPTVKLAPNDAGDWAITFADEVRTEWYCKRYRAELRKQFGVDALDGLTMDSARLARFVDPSFTQAGAAVELYVHCCKERVWYAARGCTLSLPLILHHSRMPPPYSTSTHGVAPQV